MSAAQYHLPEVLRAIVLDYLPDRELQDWIYPNGLDKIDWTFLSANPAAIQLLESHPDKINWNELSKNPAAIHLLEANPDKIDWHALSKNTAAIHLLEANQDKIDWKYVARNPNAENLIRNNLDKTHFHDLIRNPKCFHYCVDSPDEWFDEDSGTFEYAYELYFNKGDEAFNLVYSLDEKMYGGMYANPLAIKYMPKDLDSLSPDDWDYLSKNPAAMHILEANVDKIDMDSWISLSKNPAAIDLLKANPGDIDWDRLMKNPGIFSLVPKSEIGAML